ncbi:hypothetical protein IV203_034486 [Nitzschia inconspicua]|uniref:Uncharacterized protein n=1 Tax=Nitzschia inconspicua TaxID=303405 RepID=A0A9K3LDC9_9STRA|nr:hypothetical protein IV203_002543 [Nitzschia inconspicua]KAG7359388.1 hypothetical protein IV203_034486 [Nitzschia inconspicua]
MDAPPATQLRQRNSNTNVGRGNARSYTMREKLYFLSNMKEILPTDQVGWEKVLEMHNEEYSIMKRDVKKLRRKFVSLYRTWIVPGEDPCLSEDVRLAKQVRRLIIAKNTKGSAAGNQDTPKTIRKDDNVERKAKEEAIIRPVVGKYSNTFDINTARSKRNDRIPSTVRIVSHSNNTTVGSSLSISDMSNQETAASNDSDDDEYDNGNIAAAYAAMAVCSYLFLNF